METSLKQCACIGRHASVTLHPYKNTYKFVAVETLKYPHTDSTYIKPISVLSNNHNVPTGWYYPGKDIEFCHTFLFVCTTDLYKQPNLKYVYVVLDNKSMCF
jgi:hypothetical protein